jgi:hypothetical protein
VQITAPQQWLQLLAGIGIEHVQVRGIRASDKPLAENRGSDKQPSYHVVGIITKGEQLRLPGGTFSRADRAKLRDFFDRLAADGAESLTAARGRFGLTEKELSTVLTDLSQPILFETKDQPTRTVLGQFKTVLKNKPELNAAAERALQEAPPFADELKGVTTGTGLAIWLRNYGLAMRPEKLRGQPVVYRIEPLEADTLGQSTLGNPESPEIKFWPIGWQLEKAPAIVAPSLMESLNAEIDGYSLDEALAAVTPRLKVPLYLDHAALTARKIETASVQVKVARARMSYKRLLDRILTQARLGSSLRVDENGKPFVWVTR